VGDRRREGVKARGREKEVSREGKVVTSRSGALRTLIL
jgi:hypothetical protein